MSREQTATCPLAADQFALLALHRHAPEASLTELIRRSESVGDPVRLSLFHLASCPRCGPALLVGNGVACLRGRRLFLASRGWRPRPDPA